MKKLMVNVVSYIPAGIFCLYSFILLIEYETTGINYDTVGAIPILSTICIVLSSITLFLRHKDKTDFILPFILNGLSVYRLLQVIAVMEKHIDFYR